MAESFYHQATGGSVPGPAGVSNALDLRPLTTGELIDRIFQLYRRHFVKLFLFAAIISSAGLLFSILFAYFNSPRLAQQLLEDPTPLIPVGIAYGLKVIVSVLGTGILLSLVSELYQGRETALREAWKFLRGKTLALFWTGLLLYGLLGLSALPAVAAFGAALYAGMILFQPLAALGFIALWILLLVPYLVFYVRYWLTWQVVMLEGLSGWKALRRSRDLVTYDCGLGFWYWGAIRLSIVLLILFVISMLISAISAAPQLTLNIIDLARGAATPRELALSPVVVITQLLNYIGVSIVLPLYIIARILFYYDIRIRKEGFDLEVLARSLDAARQAP